MGFTAEQLQAIDISRLGTDACIVAGPGSGKTTVLVERYRQLITNGVDPSQILAITFTIKAAANMRSRLAKQFEHDADVLSKLERASVSTIHGFCTRLLREHATAAGVDPAFAVLDEQLAALERARTLRETLDQLTKEQPAAMAHLLDATNGADLEEFVPEIYDAVRAAGMTMQDLRGFTPPQAPSLDSIRRAVREYADAYGPKPNTAQKKACATAQEWIGRVLNASSHRELHDLLGEKPFTNKPGNSPKELVEATREDIQILRSQILDRIFDSEHDLLVQIFERFDDAYRKRKFELARLDFNDLELYAVRLLRDHPEIKTQVNEHFAQVMTDEFQDTSAQQSQLIELVRGPGRLYAVGDLNQSIYSFRHASPRVFNAYLETVRSSQGHASELVDNWRSRADILRAARLILNDAEGITKRDLVPARTLPERDDPCLEVMVFEAPEFEDDDDDDGNTDGSDAAAGNREIEAAWIVRRIAELRETLTIRDGEKPRLNDFAILLRKSSEFAVFQNALEKADFEYNFNRRAGFFETREARNLTHLLRMIYNPQDDASLLAVLRSDFAGLSDEALLRLKLHGKSLAGALTIPDEIALTSEDRQRITRFLPGFASWREEANYVPVDRLLLRALDEMGVDWNPRTPAGANIEKFLNIARSYSDMTLGEFITHLAAMRKTNAREADLPPDETRDAVQIMTAHAAKGLEFPIVIIAAAEAGVQTGGSDCLNFTPQYGLGVKWSLDGVESHSGLTHKTNSKQIKQTDEEEANRLLYVALTRAEEHLILSWTRDPKKKPANWAKRLTEVFGLAAQQTLAAPERRTVPGVDGKDLHYRLTCTSERPPQIYGDGSSSSASPLLVLDPPALTKQFHPNTTATALSQFAVCPRKYYLASDLGWNGEMLSQRAYGPGARSGDNGAAQLGTEVHALLAGADVPQPSLEALRLAQTFERSPLGKRAEKAKRREKEWDFIFSVDDLIVRGTIDLWFQDGQGITLVDYKTNDIKASEADDRARDYELQIALYAHALERATGQPPHQAVIHFLEPNVVRAVDLTQSAARLAQTARAFMNAQETSEFPLTVGPHCQRCEFFRTICPAKPAAVKE